MSAYTSPPRPTDQAEANRVEHTRLRRRVMYSTHGPDVQARIVERVGIERAGAWGRPHLARNPYQQVWGQISVGQYREVPEVEPPPGAEDVAAAVAESGFWQLAQRLHRDTLALNEMLVRVDLVDGLPVYRPVFPDMVAATVDPARPSRVLTLDEWTPDPDKEGEWVRLHVDPRSASYQALDRDGIDVSQRVLGGTFSGDAYPWKDASTGEALLPYVTRHRAETGWLWDPYSGSEVVEGTIELGVLYAEWSWVMLQASWPQRYVIGAEPAGMDVSERSGRITVDPAVILRLVPTEDLQGSPSAGQWANSADPAMILGAIRDYERDLVEAALGGAQVSRTTSDIRSGYSLAVSREAQREAQRAYEPLARKADLDLLRLTSRLMGFPSEGWRVSYKGLPRDPGEVQGEIDRLTKMLEAGLTDRVAAYRELHPGTTTQEAEAALAEIARINRTFAA